MAGLDSMELLDHPEEMDSTDHLELQDLKANQGLQDKL